MKKYIIASIVVIVAFFLVLFLTKDDANDKPGIKYLTMSKLTEKLSNGDDFVLIISQDGCSHCIEYLPIAEEVAKKNKITIYDLNLTKLSQSDKNELSSNFKNLTGTPTTIFVKNGKEESMMRRIDGSSTKETLEEKLRKEGYIK